MDEKRDEKEKNLDFSDKYIRWFSELSNKDVPIAGGKGASLGEMFNNKFPVPPGFVVTSEAFDLFISDLRDKIKNTIIGIDFENTEELQEKTKQIREMIIEQDMPDELKQEILEDYHILGGEEINEKGVSVDALNILKNSQEPIFVSVRSSATTEDLADASFAGQQQSFLNVKGDYDLIEHVKMCFASLYTARAVYYRNKKGFSEEEALLAVVVQKMVDSEKSGVVFSKDPTSLDENVIIEAVFGLGEGIVSGKILPDNYVVSGGPENFKLEKTRVANKKIAIVRSSSGENKTVSLTPEKSNEQVLTKGMLFEIADYALKLEGHYKKPQDIEFAIENEKVYIVQSRPITTKGVKVQGELSGTVLLEGLAASPGVGVGVVRIVHSMDDLRKIKKGDVLVTEMTDPDMVVSMQKSAAIVTDEGGLTSHASIVSREMGIPAIVGTGEATSKLKDGQTITVDGSNGKVYDGQVAETRMVEVKEAKQPRKIKLKVIVDLPEFAERAAESKIDTIGLTRIEGMIASMGKHPLQYEKENALEQYTNILEESIDKIFKPFKQMWIRSSDIRSDEYSNLKGSAEEEINPMMGLHGIRFALKHPRIFEAELQAIKNIAEKNPDKKIGVMFPLVISIDELRKAKEYFNKFKISNMQVGVMIETPAAVQIIEDICKEGVDFVSFGTNDLTQFTLAVDRNEDLVQDLYNELHPAVLSQIGYVIDVCKKYNIETSICGQAGSRKEMAEFLLKKGINSISVNADAAFDIGDFLVENEGSVKQEVKEENQIHEIEEKLEEIEDVDIEKARQKRKEFDKRKQDGMISREELKPEQREDKQELGENTENFSNEKKKDPRRINCSDCGKETKLPFKPRGDGPFYCKKCYKKKKQAERDNNNQNYQQNNNQQERQESSGLFEDKKGELLPQIQQENIEPVTHEEIGEMRQDVEEVREKHEDIQEKAMEAEKQTVQEEQTEHIGPVHAIDSKGRIDERTDDIQEDVEKKKEDVEEQNQGFEDKVETSVKDNQHIRRNVDAIELEKEEYEEAKEELEEEKKEFENNNESEDNIKTEAQEQTLENIENDVRAIENEKKEVEKEEEKIEESVGDDFNTGDIGVYNPEEEEQDNSPEAMKYKFDEEDEDVFSDVF